MIFILILNEMRFVHRLTRQRRARARRRRSMDDDDDGDDDDGFVVRTDERGSGDDGLGTSAVDVESVCDAARIRLRVLHGLEHVLTNYRGQTDATTDSATTVTEEDGTSTTTTTSRVDGILRAWCRGLFVNDARTDAASEAATRLAFCCAERRDEGKDDSSSSRVKKLVDWEYGCDWLARLEQNLLYYRILNGERSVPEEFTRADCEFDDASASAGLGGGSWMAFERAPAAVRMRSGPMRRGYVFVPDALMPRVYAEFKGKEIRADLAKTSRRLRSWLAERKAPRAFDPNCSTNVLRAIRTWTPDIAELPAIPVQGGMGFAKRRRERRRGYGGAAKHAVALEEDGRQGEERLGGELKRAYKMLSRNASKVQARPFPPCMRDKFEKLSRFAHLQYADRFELNLFLKGVGLTVNETLMFWRKGVFPKGKMKAYQGEHTYAIRHHYGLEGAMKDYTPHNCASLQGKHEGRRSCPFVSAGDVETFRNENSARPWYQELSLEGRERVENMVFSGNPCAACEQVFVDAHGGTAIGADFAFPADYFDASMEIEDMYTTNMKLRRRDASDDGGSTDDVASDGAVLPKTLAVEDSSSDDEP